MIISFISSIYRPLRLFHALTSVQNIYVCMYVCVHVHVCVYTRNCVCVLLKIIQKYTLLWLLTFKSKLIYLVDFPTSTPTDPVYHFNSCIIFQNVLVLLFFFVSPIFSFCQLLPPPTLSVAKDDLLGGESAGQT